MTSNVTSAAGVEASTASALEAGPGASPRAALQDMMVACIAIRIAKELIVLNHYLHTLPGGTAMAFGVLLGGRLLGALTLGAGPTNAYRLVEGASPRHCIALTRLWLSEELPPNAESRVIGIVLRNLARHTDLKFVVSYADPSQGHVGTIYQASNWLYLGLSQATPLYSLAGESPRHSRSFSHSFGTRDVSHFAARGVPLHKVPQQPKHRYFYPLDPSCRDQLSVPVLPYPKLETQDAIGEDRWTSIA